MLKSWAGVQHLANWYITSILEELAAFVISFFMFMWPCIVTDFFVIKPTRCTNFTNLFCRETLHVSDSLSVHHQEFYSQYTKQWYISYRFVDSFRAYTIHIPLLSVQWINSWWWTDELSETCRFSRQNKFVKLVHPVGFITKKVLEVIHWDSKGKNLQEDTP
jgi:hypothetical protein